MNHQTFNEWIHTNSSLLCEQVESLDNTRIFIDASRISNIIYEISCENSRHDLIGGDLIHYGKLVKRFLENLIRSGLRPTLVFDGSVSLNISSRDCVPNLENPKTQCEGEQLVEDAFNRLHSEIDRQISENYESIRVRENHLIDLTFKRIAVEKKLPVIICPYNSRGYLVRLAIGCPILSTDSSLILDSAKTKLVLFNSSLAKQLFIPATNIITLSAFRTELLHEFCPKLDSHHLKVANVILSSRLGSSHQNRIVGEIDSVEMDNLYLQAFKGIRAEDGTDCQVANSYDSNENEQEVENNCLVANSDDQKKIMRLFAYLSSMTSDAAIKLLNALTSGHIGALMLGNNETKLKLGKTPLMLELERFFNKDYANHLCYLFNKRALSVDCLDMIFNNIQYKYDIVDDSDQPCASLVLHRPYSLALAILRDKARTSAKEHLNSYKYYGRDGDRIKCYELAPEENFSESRSSLETLCECFHLREDDLESSAELQDRHDLATTLKLCFAFLKRYIPSGRNTEVPVEFVKAVFLAICCYQENLEEKAEDLCAYAIGKESDYADNSDVYREIMHCIMQLQLTFKAFNVVNCLLGSPIEEQVHLYIDWKMVYRLTEVIMSDDECFRAACGGCVWLNELWERFIA